MSTIENTRKTPAVREVFQLRERIAALQLDYYRLIATLPGPQRPIAAELHISQPSLSSVLRTARTIPQIPEGFSGASPSEIAQRYAARLITRAQVVDELSRWNYAATPVAGDDFDWLEEQVPGTLNEVVAAVRKGQLEPDVYDEILEAVAAKAAAA